MEFIIVGYIINLCCIPLVSSRVSDQIRSYNEEFKAKFGKPYPGYPRKFEVMDLLPLLSGIIPYFNIVILIIVECVFSEFPRYGRKYDREQKKLK